jgi:hypothetical protein
MFASMYHLLIKDPPMSFACLIVVIGGGLLLVGLVATSRFLGEAYRNGKDRLRLRMLGLEGNERG